MYISPWLILIGIAFAFIYFKFIRKNNIQKTPSVQFIGRHQKAILVREYLGERIPQLEYQVAINNDNLEHKEVAERVRELEDYIKSENFTSGLDVQSVNKKIAEMFNEFIKTSVLEFDRALKDRCLKIFDSTNEHITHSLQQQGNDAETFADSSKQLKALWHVEGLLAYLKLGGLLKDNSYEQNVWMIMNIQMYSNDIISGALSLLTPEGSQDNANQLTEVAKGLAKQGKIDQKVLNRVEKEIKAGLSYSRENYQVHLKQKSKEV
ncbi:MAG: hypothetical protein MOGMAGMI_01644 [Candidatus Omnitrophica bacterium]|nr:hypothetical protein [Candidatus Omnitrophota bacterium]